MGLLLFDGLQGDSLERAGPGVEAQHDFLRFAGLCLSIECADSDRARDCRFGWSSCCRLYGLPVIKPHANELFERELEPVGKTPVVFLARNELERIRSLWFSTGISNS